MSELMDTLCRYVNNDDDLPPDILAEVIEQLGFLKHDFEVLRAENKQLKEAQRWIPVSERLPELPDGAYGTRVYGYYEEYFDTAYGEQVQKTQGEIDYFISDEEGNIYTRPYVTSVETKDEVTLIKWRNIPAAPEAE